MKKNYFLSHTYHIVDSSPWPLIVSFGAFFFTFGFVMYMHSYSNGLLLTYIGLVIILFIMFLWWRDVVRESTFMGFHTELVRKGLKLGFILFIISEVMFFLSFFWGFFHSSLSPAIELGSIWPPLGIEVFNVWDIPFLNTLILLLSGASVTLIHYAIMHPNYSNYNYRYLSKRRKLNSLELTVLSLKFKKSLVLFFKNLNSLKFQIIFGFLVTIFLAFIFTGLQIFEYLNASFSISDSIYGSTFFMLTGFHGFHVLVGTIFLLVCFLRFLKTHFSVRHHLGFEAAAWYWHFVDLVWLFLLIVVYWWGNWS